MNEQYYNYMKAVETLGKRINELELDLWLRTEEIKDLKAKLEEAERAGKENGTN